MADLHKKTKISMNESLATAPADPSRGARTAMEEMSGRSRAAPDPEVASNQAPARTDRQAISRYPGRWIALCKDDVQRRFGGQDGEERDDEPRPDHGVAQCYVSGAPARAGFEARYVHCLVPESWVAAVAATLVTSVARVR